MIQSEDSDSASLSDSLLSINPSTASSVVCPSLIGTLAPFIVINSTSSESQEVFLAFILSDFLLFVKSGLLEKLLQHNALAQA